MKPLLIALAAIAQGQNPAPSQSAVQLPNTAAPPKASPAAVAPVPQIPFEPPKVLRIIREFIKPGKTSAHERASMNAVRLLARAKAPANFIGLSAVSGDEEVWFIESHDSFASIEAADTFVGNSPALRWNLNQLEAQDAELVSSTRRLLAVYRKDLSYRGDQLALRLPNTRYFSVVMVGLHPARDAEFSNIVGMVAATYEKVKSDQPLVVYQVVSGSAGLTYLFFSPMPSLQTMDAAAARGRAVREAMGEENAAAMLKTSAEVTATTESLLFALNPRLSYVSREFAALDPDFWTPKPPPKPPVQPGTPDPSPAPGPPGPAAPK
ncbi:MAG: hypothetical protein DMG57_11340 [Acidobacteria bacterium]|nr:MAG: hypothetical protein DMG57_11340 [Acidobacteriota bacterium]